MKQHAAGATCLTVFLLSCVPLQAHPGHDQPRDVRTWKDAEGLFEMEASFVVIRNGKVQLCKHDGSLVWIPVGKLSPEDQGWLRKRAEAIRKLNAAESEPASRPAFPALVIVFAMILVVGAAVVLRRRGCYLFAPLVLVWLMGLLTGPATGQATEGQKAPPIQKHFEPFREKLQFRWDNNFFYVGSNAFPDHPMMVGIKAWQQQVPLPQPYTGKNAWQIPLHPVLAEKPISARKALYRGAIALAVNGVPIFNALNNRGEDAYLAGELDEYGGHCGRGDDYHYHVAPVHLERIVGKGKPIGYALDGFPLYSYTDAEGKEPKDLDEFNGRMEKDGYRYYSTKTYPYINGGLRGVVTVRDDQVEPQPRDAPVRPAQRPLRGARITKFVRDDANKTYTLEYELRGKPHTVRYTLGKDGAYAFRFTDSDGKQTTRIYRRRPRPERKEDHEETPGDPNASPMSRHGGPSWFEAHWRSLSLLGAGVLMAGSMMCLVVARWKQRLSRFSKWSAVLLVIGLILLAGGAFFFPPQPWLAAHFDELDTNHDDVLTLEEMKEEVERTFVGLDTNNDGQLTKDEYDVARPEVRSALAGFVRRHAAEITDSHGVITKEGLHGAITRMFEKADIERRGELTRGEAAQ